MLKNSKIIFILLTLFVIQIGLIFFYSQNNDNNKSIIFFQEVKKEKDPELFSQYSYFMNSDFFDEAYQNVDKQIKYPESKVYGGIIPHHLIVKDKIAAFFEGIKKEKYKTIILIGPNHFDAGKGNILASNAKWITPYGEIRPDSSLIKKLDLGVEENPFIKEHSISGLISFIKRSLPESEIVPIIIKVNTSNQEIEDLAKKISDNVDKNDVLVVSSVDFSHYQNKNTADYHDNQSNSIIKTFDFDRIDQMEIDSPPSIYLLLKYLELNKIQKSELLFSTNSGSLMAKEYEPTTSHNIYYFEKGNRSEKSVLNLLFFGDLMLDRNVKTKIKNSDLDYILADFEGEEKRFFAGSDLISANLEGAVSNNGDHYNPVNAYDFAFDPNLVNKLHDYNFDHFTLSNNHFSDQGKKGMEETYTNLDKLKFDYSGCADKVVSDCSSKIITRRNFKIGIAGFSMVYGTFDQEKANEVVKKLKNESDLVIVNLHAGTEYTHFHSDLQQQVARSFVDSGADMVIGHHPHVVQGMEIYRGKPIFYSLGNFIFDQYFSYDTQEGLSVGISQEMGEDKKYKIYLFPFVSSKNKLKLMDEPQSKAFFEKFIKWSDLEEKYEKQVQKGIIGI